MSLSLVESYERFPVEISELQQMLRLVHPYPLGVRAVEPEHEPHCGSVLDRPWRLLSVEVLVVCGSAHTKDPAQVLYAELASESVHRL